MRENCTYSLSGGRWLARKRATSDPTATKRSNLRGAKGTGHSRHGQLGQLATGGADWLWRRAAARKDGTSRVTGDSHARFCERLGVKFPGPTRRRSAMVVPTATYIIPPRVKSW